jgi:FeS assembly protein IscX
MTSWTWQDIDAIALVARLPEFRDVPGDGTEKTLEAIQAAWYEEYEN